MGYIETCVVPVYHGYPVLSAYQVQNIGGKAIEAEIRSLLETHYSFKEPGRVSEIRELPDEVIEEIKGKYNYLNFFFDLKYSSFIVLRRAL